MPLEITFTISDADLERFQAIVSRAEDTVADERAAEQVEAAARDLIAKATQDDLPEFIGSRIAKLGVLLDMINDDEWQLADEERQHVVSALAYLCDPEDLIPDHIPGLGFLDDAIYTEIVLQELGNEVHHYEEFCIFRDREEKRLAARGEDTTVGREAWLAEKRSTLHRSMRQRRSEGRRILKWRLSHL